MNDLHTLITLDGQTVRVDELISRITALEEELAGWVKSHDDLNRRLIAMTEFYEG